MAARTRRTPNRFRSFRNRYVSIRTMTAPPVRDTLSLVQDLQTLHLPHRPRVIDLRLELGAAVVGVDHEKRALVPDRHVLAVTLHRQDHVELREIVDRDGRGVVVEGDDADGL